jgi:hypothetical protein
MNERATVIGFQFDEAVPVLERTPEVVRALLEGLPPPAKRYAKAVGPWARYPRVLS